MITWAFLLDQIHNPGAAYWSLLEASSNLREIVQSELGKFSDPKRRSW